MRILLATNNQGKLKEMKDIFSIYFPNVELISLNDLKSISEPEENADTFLGNALIKAKYYFDAYKIPVISDDTGLCVDFLNGQPGVHTARYGSINGEHTDPVKNYMRIIKELEGASNRKAYFRTAMVYYDKHILVTSFGQMDGEISLEPFGTNGFGYDPVFYLPEYGKTVSELDSEIKNKISHRGKASINLVNQLKNLGVNHEI